MAKARDKKGAAAPTPAERAARKKRQRRRRAWVSGALVALLTAFVVVARTQWAADEVARILRTQVTQRTGLSLEIGRVYFSWRHFAVRAENIALRHPREGLLARVDTLEVAPAFLSLFSSSIKIARIGVDGGRVDLRFRRGQLVNGPTLPPQPPSNQPLELPFADIAVSDMRFHVEHDQLGTFDLPSVDLDLHNDHNRRVLLGVLAQGGGAIRGAQCFNGPVGRIEARAEITDRFHTLRVAMARVELGRVTARVRDAVVPLDLHGTLRADAELSAPIPSLLCVVPHAPALRGDVSVRVRAEADLDARRFRATGSVRADRISLSTPFPDRTYNYQLADDVQAEITATQDEIRVDSLRARFAGATIVSPGRRPDNPIVVRLGAHPTLEGHYDFTGLDFPQLMHAVTITDFTKVMWTIDAGVDMHGALERFALPADPQRPALWLELDAETRNFAILRDFHQRTPQHPLIAIPRAHVVGTITVDPEHLRFRRFGADFGHSHIDVGLAQIRFAHDDAIPDFVLEGGRGNNIHLEDVGRVADLAVGGTASITAEGRGPFADPVITGQAHLRNFSFNGLPLGDFDTRAGSPWHFQNIRVDIPVVDARAGRSNFTIADAYLDFRRYTLTAGARIATTNFFTADFFHMFQFEGDPTFAPYDGRTMPRCRANLAAGVAPRETADVPCVDPGAAHANDPRRPSAPQDTDSGHLQANLSYVLGRPGDHSDGVLEVDVTARDLTIRAFDETIRDLDGHVSYRWLDRTRGFRGARVQIDYARGRVGGGTIEASGSTDLGGTVHLVARGENIALERLDLLHGQNVTGTANGIVTLEGLPDAPRVTADLSIHGLVAAQRNIGEVTMAVRGRPDGARSADPTVRPPRNRYDITVDALSGVLHAQTSVVSPWRAVTWRDTEGVTHPDWERSWDRAVVTGHVELTRPLDLLPLLPTSVVARLGDNAVANVRARIEIERAVIGDYERADLRVAVDRLEIGAQGLRFSLADGAVLAACVHNGAYWIDAAAANSNAPCARVPPRLLARRQTARGQPEPPTAQIVGPEGTRLGLAGGGTFDGRLDLALRGEVDLARIAPLVSGITWARGTAYLRVDVSGDTDNPQLAGALSLDGGALGADVLPNPIDDIHLLVRLSGTEARLERARAAFGPSSIDLTGGFVRLQGRDIDRVDIPLVVRNLALQPQTGVEVALNSDARLTWTHGDDLPVFAGDVSLLRVRYTRPITLLQDASGDVRATSSDSVDEPYDPNNDRVRLDLRVHAREPIRVLNNLLDAEIRVAEEERPFRVLGTDQRVGILGTLVVPRGRVLFRGYEFEVRRGRVEFDNPERIQPNFDIGAQVDIRRGNQTASSGVSVEGNQWRIQMHAYGIPERFSLDMSSEPTLSREDIAFLLAFRMTRAEIDQIASGGNLAQAGQGLAVEALASATGVEQAVGRTVRTFIPVIEDFRIGSAYSPAQGRTVPQVSVGRRINDRVRIGATVNTTEQREMRATTDVRIDDRTSVQAGYENVNDAASSQVGNIGADLRWRLEFE